MLELPNVTLIGIDCLDLNRLQLACDISTKEIKFGKVKLLSSIESEDKRVVAIEKISSTEEYSLFMIKELDKHIDTEFAIIFQYDGFILNTKAWSNEFLKYDYIGAPWYHLGDLRVGNGGFSLRSKKLIDWLAKNYDKIDAKIHPEDVFISRFARPMLEKDGLVFADEKTASLFSKEGNDHSVVWNNEFGFHGIKNTDISLWKEQNPGYDKRLDYPLDDYCSVMKKYPIYDGTVHTFMFEKYAFNNLRKISENKKNYEIRRTKTKNHNWENVLVGHIIIFRRFWGVSLEKFSVKAFDKKITELERFENFYDLRKKYPRLEITPNLSKLPRWAKILAYFSPDSFCDKNVPYTIFWF